MPPVVYSAGCHLTFFIACTTTKKGAPPFRVLCERVGGSAASKRSLGEAGQPSLTGPPLANVVYTIRNNDDLNAVTLAFLSFRELTGDNVKMFDFSAVNSWCDKHQAQCK